jgi:hypothetical protein
MWADCDSDVKSGDFGFVVRCYDTSTGREWCVLQDSPGRKNLSGEPILRGWLGETNNVSCTALGVVQVARVCGSRASCAFLEPPQRSVALEDLGWPELDAA